jgi:N-acetylmuramoyl-L-alanine amidase
MIKKLFLIIFSIICFTQAAFSQGVFKITSVNFDTSNSLIFLTSPDDTTEAIMKNVKLTKLANPKRVYFDINSAVLTKGTQNWFLNSGGVNQVKVSQFSTNPSKVRVVLYLDENFDQSKISFLKVNNNIVIKFKDGMCENDYFQMTYRDEHNNSSDFYENLSISNEKLETAAKTIQPQDTPQYLNQIQGAFSSPQGASVKPVSAQTPDITNGLYNKTTLTPSPLKGEGAHCNSASICNVIQKELKLKSKYYMNAICVKSNGSLANGFLVSGFGVIGIEKPMYLTNPARVVFDIPNAIANPELKGKEFKIGEDTVKLGQFERNKVRVVITSTELEKYIPIYSSDGQSVFIVKNDEINNDDLFSKTTDATGYYVKQINPLTDEFIISFNTPVVHSVRRDDTKLTINLFNALRYNEDTFRSMIGQTALDDMRIDLLPRVGLKLVVPVEKDNLINCYLGSDGKSVRVIIKRIKPKKSSFLPETTVILPRIHEKCSVVLDPGHGGSDYGAIRCGINEKDINLDVAKRVEAILESKGVAVTMTRNTDVFVSLEDRTIITSKVTPDIFVSIHVNSSVKPEITGIETHYYHPNSLNLAHTIHESLISIIRTIDRGLFRSRFYVINHTTTPAILVEMGFLSNNNERCELISEKRKEQTAEAIANGILKYLNKR